MFNREHQLLIRCAEVRKDSSRPGDPPSLTPTGINWAYLVETARRHGMLPLVYWGLKDAPDAGVPENTAKELRAVFYANVGTNVFLAGELIKKLALFDEHEVACVPLRGPTLASALYDDPALRPAYDLDVLIRRRDADKVCKLLVADNYRPAVDVPDFSHGHPANGNSLLFVSEAGRGSVYLDLHWMLFPSSFFHRGDDWDIWDFDQYIFGGRPTRGFVPEDLLIVLCLHGAKHAWDRLLWICDVARLLCAHPTISWRRALDKADALGCMRALCLGLCLANELAGSSLPDEALRRIKLDRKLAPLAGRIRERLFSRAPGLADKIERDRLTLAVQERLTDRLGNIRHLLCAYTRQIFTPNEKDFRLFHLPDALSFCYYLFKPFRLIAEYGTPALKWLWRKPLSCLQSLVH